MKRQIQIEKLSLSYVLKRNKRSKHVRLIVHSDGSLVVTAPKWTSVHVIEGFLCEKRAWLGEMLKGVKIGEENVQQDKERYKTYKHQALEFVREKVELYNSVYNFSYNKISIRNQRSRWGSCSSQGNLSFSYKILFLPEDLAEYLVVHELAHLKEMNHSPRFWAVVEHLIPDYRRRVRDLRKYERESL